MFQQTNLKKSKWCLCGVRPLTPTLFQVANTKGKKKMKNFTQKSWVAVELATTGTITRNQCLRNYISRLGAIIADLKKDGWEFEAHYIEVNTPFGKGKDYQYRATYIPEAVEAVEVA